MGLTRVAFLSKGATRHAQMLVIAPQNNTLRLARALGPAGSSLVGPKSSHKTVVVLDGRSWHYLESSL